MFLDPNPTVSLAALFLPPLEEMALALVNCNTHAWTPSTIKHTQPYALQLHSCVLDHQ